ncbi:MAG TPA: winged helix DNA-binding domain-containing protein, partial [Thermoanaerobaculia bacterium]
MSRLSLRALNRALLARHMLLARETAGVVAAVERLAGMQAQVPRPPYIGLWSRLADFHRDALTNAVVKRDLVRATLMRGTLHLVSKKDYLAFRPALQPMLARGADAIVKDAIAEREPILRDARKFFGRNACTFDELRKHLVERHPGVGDRAMGYLARMHLPLVQVPSAAAAWGYPAIADFALADAYFGKAVPADGKPDALALRYFAAFGPATAADFQNWSGMQGGKEIVAAIRGKLESVRDERNRELFDVPGAPRPDE